MKTKGIIAVLILLAVGVMTAALWRVPISAYRPQNADEGGIKTLLVNYIHARNSRMVEQFLATLHDDCRYMVSRDRMATKDDLRKMLPGFWMQNDDDTVAFGKCMAWECWNENYYATGMLINPRFQFAGDQAFVRLQFHAGLFLDENFFHLIRENGRWQIIKFERPIY